MVGRSRDPLSDQIQSFRARSKTVRGWPDHPFLLTPSLSSPLQDGRPQAGHALYKGTRQWVRAEILPGSTHQAGFIGVCLCLWLWRCGSFFLSCDKTPARGWEQFSPSHYHIPVLPQMDWSLKNRLVLLWKMKYLTQNEINFIGKAQNITMGMNYVGKYLYSYVHLVMWIHISMYQKWAQIRLSKRLK